MSCSTPQLCESGGAGLLRRRCAELGLPTWRFDASGGVLSAPFEEGLAGRWLRSPVVRRAVEDVVRRWIGRAQAAGDPIEVFPGCWLIPLPEMSRRRWVGYTVAVALTLDVLGAEQFDAACQAASMDAELARKRLSRGVIFEKREVERLARMLVWLNDDCHDIARSAWELDHASQQLGEAYEEISLLYTLGRSMNELADPGRFVGIACDELRAAMSFRWVAARFVNDPDRARTMAGRQFTSGALPCSEDEFEQDAEAAMQRLQTHGPLVIPAGERGRLGTGESELLLHPIRYNGRIVGALMAGDKEGDDREVNSVDMKPLENAAGFVAVLLENAFLYEEQQLTFLGTLEALTASIDAKDPYTCGHSERVAELAYALALETGLSEEEADRVRVAGLVHDIGKIGVPEAVLCKPGRLTEEEFELIKLHPQIGYDILKDIPSLADVLPGVLYHHERYDGRGYPASLEGEDIPLMARLLGLADAFDAMSSNRTYRAAMARETTIEEIEKNAGTQFDPELARAFLRLDLGFYDDMVIKHQRESEKDARGSLRRTVTDNVLARLGRKGGEAA